MYRVSPIRLSFIPNILQTLHYAKSSPPLFSLKILEIKKFGNFLSDSDVIPPSSLYAAFKRENTVR